MNVMVDSTIDRILSQHRRKLLTVLLIPALAIIVALILIIALSPSRLIPITIIIVLVLFQYLFFVAYIWRKLIARK